ncbi:MAG TPA: hypothetical protein H9873_01655 [Candidatus Dorea gallistercoris]|uniref:NB-ARC domain-containing protein n=1 Tax=Candidatus Dorea gallistercoris TaxID=2838542 RepID=A0A9D1R9K8_9FIRM|nr:hypothetical protein [Candidatus Dorea gallistercoris]
MLGHMEKKQYKKAMEIADTIDWRRVKSTSMLNTVSEIYEFCGEFQKSRDILFVAFDRAPGSRKIIYRLGLLALKINDIEEASDCYEEFVKAAPKDPNQYILKYKILKAQNAPLTDQIAALEDFKKAEYVEKWAYELASLYHEAGMTAKCLEECDDLILWFSEGKYVYEAMELKMKYKPLTPIQQEKYDSRPGAPKLRKTVRKVQPEEPALRKGETQNYVKAEEADTVSSQTETEPDQPEEEAGSAESMESASADIEEKEAAVQEPADEEAANEEPEAAEGSEASEEPTERPAPIKRVVKGATLEEALANGVAIANNINIEEKAMAEREEELRIGGQMKIEEILQEWEEKQKINAEAIEKQKAKDNERLQKEREAARKRQEAERLEVERKAAEAEAARKAAEAEAARKAAEAEAARKAAEEEAARKAAEEEAAIRKAAEEEAARKAAEEEAEEKVPSGATQRLPDDIMELVDQLESRVAQAEEDSDDIFDVEEELELTSSEEELPENMPKEEPDGFFDDGQEDFEEVDYEDGGDYEEAEFEDEADYEDEDDYEEAEFEDEADYEDEDDYEEAEFEDEDTFDKNDFFDEDFEVKDTPEEPLEIEEPSEEEIQRRIKKSKGGGVPFDTGFVVTGRYDLSATSEIGLKAGLTEEQKKLFSYFVPVRGMSEQIVEVLDNDRRAMREGTSKTGNLLVVGRKGSGKTVLAVDIVKAIQKQRNLRQGKVAIVTGESLNKKELTNIIQKLKGGAIIIEKAGKLNSRTIKELNHLMERKTGEMLFVLEDQRKPLERILAANPDFKKKFTSKLELPVFINDELVTFGQTYAKENGYKLDEMGILALYSRIDVMQREDHAVSVAEVKDIMDEAIAHSQKANVKHLARRVFGKSTDASDRIILKEEDFRI